MEAQIHFIRILMVLTFLFKVDHTGWYYTIPGMPYRTSIELVRILVIYQHLVHLTISYRGAYQYYNRMVLVCGLVLSKSYSHSKPIGRDFTKYNIWFSCKIILYGVFLHMFGWQHEIIKYYSSIWFVLMCCWNRLPFAKLWLHDLMWCHPSFVGPLCLSYLFACKSGCLLGHFINFWCDCA